MTREEQKQRDNTIQIHSGTARIVVRVLPIETKYQMASGIITADDIGGDFDKTKKSEVVSIGAQAQKEFPNIEIGDIVLRPQGSGHPFTINGDENYSIGIHDVIAFYKKAEYDKYLQNSLGAGAPAR